MAVKTVNSYGKISISDEAIEMVAGSTALECYGVVDLVAKRLSDSFAQMFKKQQLKKGVKVLTVDNKIYIDFPCKLSGKMSENQPDYRLKIKRNGYTAFFILSKNSSASFDKY